MYPKAFDYVRAESIDHALAVLAEHGPNARVLAGGQSLVQQMKLRAVTPSVVVDIGGLRDLNFVGESDGRIAIGPLTRHVDVLSHRWPAGLDLITDAASVIADVQVRNRGTVCGALAFADPVGDWGPALQALGGSVRVRHRAGERVVPAAELFTGAFRTVLQPTELIAEAFLPTPAPGTSSAYVKLARRVGDAGLVSVAVSVTRAEDGTCASAGIGIGGIGPTPVKATEAEHFLAGKRLDDATVGAVSPLLLASVSPMDDARASAEYRAAMLPVAFGRAVDVALARASGQRAIAGYI